MVPVPIYKDQSRTRVNCSICQRFIICRKYYDWKLSQLEKYKIQRTEDDWICIICESEYMEDEYANQIAEGC